MKDAPPQRSANTAGKRISLVLAVVVHLVLAVFLIYGVRWQTAAPEAVEVELVRSVPVPAAVPPAPTPEPPPPAPTPQPEPKPEPKPAPPPPKPDIAINEKEKPKEPPKPVPKAPDPFQEQLKRETEQRTQQKQIDAALREHQLAQEAKAASARSKAVADYLSRIRGKIRGNIVLPPEVRGNPEAVFDVIQLPSGEIVTVKLKRSSGNVSLDAAIERAILKSSPLPKPEQADLFSRSLELKFRPLED